MLEDFGVEVSGEILSDASAALGIIARTGLGKMRHLDTNFLWIQQASAEKRLKYGKVDGKENVADLMTKHVARDLCLKHCEGMQIFRRESRHEKAPALKA